MRQLTPIPGDILLGRTNFEDITVNLMCMRNIIIKGSPEEDTRALYEAVLRQCESNGAKVYDVNGENYSPEMFSELVDILSEESRKRLKRMRSGKDIVIGINRIEDFLPFSGTEKLKRIAEDSYRTGICLVCTTGFENKTVRKRGLSVESWTEVRQCFHPNLSPGVFLLNGETVFQS